VMDNTNTVLIGFAAFGVPFGMLMVLGLWRFLKKHHSSSLVTLLLFVILFAALSNEDMGQNALYYVLVFMGLLSEPTAIGKQETAAKETPSTESLLAEVPFLGTEEVPHEA